MESVFADDAAVDVDVVVDVGHVDEREKFDVDGHVVDDENVNEDDVK